MVNLELRRQVVNVYKGMPLVGPPGSLAFRVQYLSC